MHADAEGPTFISATAWSLSIALSSTSEPLQLPSGHTNALAESFNAAVKVERVNRTAYPTRENARKDVARYIEFRYNTQRLHSALGYQTPQEVYDEYRNRQIAA
ncbi:MAG: integrase core domain-containing protein [Pseudonocardiaceae bacterium]